MPNDNRLCCRKILISCSVSSGCAKMQVAAVPQDPEAIARAASDVDDIKWVSVDSLREHPGEALINITYSIGLMCNCTVRLYVLISDSTRPEPTALSTVSFLLPANAEPDGN